MRLLIVSQDKFLVKSICDNFRYQGYEANDVDNFRDMEAVCTLNPIDVIIAERKINDIVIFDFYDKQEINSQTRDLPQLIVLTDSTEELSKEVAFAMGAWAVFSKPFNLRDLFYSVEDATYAKKTGLTKRLDERVDIIARVQYRALTEDSWTNAYSGNVSFGGFFIATQKAPPVVGEEIEFKLNISNEDILSGRGIVAWIKSKPSIGEQFGFGVRFKGSRENYVKFIVPIINEARTRQLETATFEIENIVDVLSQSLDNAKVNIAKRVLEFRIVLPQEKIYVLCRSSQVKQALSRLLYDIVYPIRSVEKSLCSIVVGYHGHKTVSIVITSEPGGISLNTDEIVENVLKPVLELHNGTLDCDFSSVQSRFIITLPIAQYGATFQENLSRI